MKELTKDELFVLMVNATGSWCDEAFKIRKKLRSSVTKAK